MLKISLCIIVLGVLLGEASADYTCLIQLLKFFNPDHIFTDADSVCQDIEYKLGRLRKEIKTCTHHKVDTALVESLHKEFCTPGSDYRQSFNMQKLCLAENFKYLWDCYTTVVLTPKTKFGRTAEEMCTGACEEIAICLNNAMKKPCGYESSKVMQRFTEAWKPFFVPLCLEVVDHLAKLDKAKVNDFKRNNYWHQKSFQDNI